MDTMNVTADADALRHRAERLLDAGQPGVARGVLAAARALGPPSPEICLIAARIALGSGATQQALSELDGGIAAAPAHAGLRKCRADLRRAIGDLEGSARDAAEAVILDAGDPQAKAILGVALLALGRIREATACLAEAVAGSPTNLYYRRVLSAAQEYAGDTDAALLALTEGIALCPQNISLRNAAILLCMRRRDFSEAEHLAEQAQSQGFADSTTFGLQGHALSSLCRHDEAAIAYQHAVECGTDDSYIRHLVASMKALPDTEQTREAYIRTMFDGYADRFESHLVALKYTVPGTIRSILQRHPKIAAGLSLGPVLDLGCGTGFVGLVIDDLPLGPITGVDLSPQMLARARAKQIYAELREADIVTDLSTHQDRWPLIIAADVLCYSAALEPLFARVHESLIPGGWFIFSVEEMLPDHDGVTPGNGNWALQRQGRYVHAADYVHTTACAAGFRVVQMDRLVIRQEAGGGVPGLLLTLERMPDDA